MAPAEQVRSFIPVRIAVLTISDSRTLADDTSGSILSERIAEAGHQLSARKIIVDDVKAIRACVRNWLDRDDIDVIISTAGTALTGRDATVQAMPGLVDQDIGGCSVALHMITVKNIG